MARIPSFALPAKAMVATPQLTVQQAQDKVVAYCRSNSDDRGLVSVIALPGLDRVWKRPRPEITESGTHADIPDPSVGDPQESFPKHLWKGLEKWNQERRIILSQGEIQSETVEFIPFWTFDADVSVDLEYERSFAEKHQVGDATESISRRQRRTRTQESRYRHFPVPAAKPDDPDMIGTPPYGCGGLEEVESELVRSWATLTSEGIPIDIAKEDAQAAMIEREVTEAQHHSPSGDWRLVGTTPTLTSGAGRMVFIPFTRFSMQVENDVAHFVVNLADGSMRVRWPTKLSRDEGRNLLIAGSVPLLLALICFVAGAMGGGVTLLILALLLGIPGGCLLWSTREGAKPKTQAATPRDGRNATVPMPMRTVVASSVSTIREVPA